MYVQVIRPNLIDSNANNSSLFQKEVLVSVEAVDYGYKDRGLPR